MARYRKPLSQLKLSYGNEKNLNYSQQDDRFLICTLHTLGFDSKSVYFKLKKAIR